MNTETLLYNMVLATLAKEAGLKESAAPWREWLNQRYSKAIPSFYSDSGRNVGTGPTRSMFRPEYNSWIREDRDKARRSYSKARAVFNKPRGAGFAGSNV